MVQRCQDLVVAPPSQWAGPFAAVVDLGPRASRPLAERLLQQLDAPGAQAAACALGVLGDPSVTPVLRRLVAGQHAEVVAAEAALALGRLRDAAAVDLLTQVAGDPTRDVTTRTAAACALLELGEVQRALPLLQAVLLADAPQGRALASQHALPERPRWVLERHLVIAAIRRHTGGETFGLDTDASWPRLAEGTARFVAWVEERKPGQRR